MDVGGPETKPQSLLDETMRDVSFLNHYRLVRNKQVSVAMLDRFEKLSYLQLNCM